MNRFLYRFKYNYGKYLRLNKPVDVSLELASQCNMRCSYCYHADDKNLPFTKGLMPYEVAQSIIKQAGEAGVESIKFNWKGESTLNPHYAGLLLMARSYANGKTFQDRLANSNFKIPPKKAAEVIPVMARHLTKVKVSYDSFRKDVFEYQRDGGNHDLTTQNIEALYNHPGRKAQVIIQAVRTKLNADEDIYHECKKRWPEAEVSIRNMVEGRVNKDLGEFTEFERDFSNRQPCKQAFVRLIFNHKGEAFPCCPDIGEHLKLGDIREQNLKEIFNGYLAQRLRDTLKDGSAFGRNPCNTCSSFESYKGYKPDWES